MSQQESRGYLGYYAGFVSRMMAFVIDTVITVFVIVAVTWFFSVTVSVFQLSTTWDYLLARVPQLERWFSWIYNPLTGSLVAIGYLYLYHALFITVVGQTPGKLLMGLRVLTTGGARVTFWRASLRFAGYFISMFILFLGFAWVLVDDRRQGWHDKIAGTYVVYAWAARPDERFLGEFLDRLRSLTSRRSIRPK
jgi:uncharacterized RDD family membrane protein YckC